MRCDVEAGGQTRVVDVSRQGGRYLVRVDGEPREVDVAVTGGGWSLLIDARSYDVRFAGQPGGGLLVYVDGRPIAVSLGRRGQHGRRGSGGTGPGASQDGPHRIVAPMPGRVVRVLVKAGDLVAPGQGLVVVEAMKMENELRSPRAGTVAEVRVAEGMSVEATSVLVVVD